MDPESLQAWFRVAVFLALVSAGLLFFQPPGTAEFVITVATLVLGLVFMGIIALLAWKANHQ